MVVVCFVAVNGGFEGYVLSVFSRRNSEFDGAL